MALAGALQVGRTALTASQTAIEIAGNNLANAATPSYHRRTVALAPIGDTPIDGGQFVGRGVEIQSITRVIDEALEGRVRGGISDAAASEAKQAILEQIEAVENELSGNDLTTHLDAFFNAFSDLSLRPREDSIRELAIQQGRSLTLFMQNLRNDLVGFREQIDQQIEGGVTNVNDLLERIATLNQQIAASEDGRGEAASLRDQRDALLGDLAKQLDISTVEQPTRMVDVFVGSTPIVLNGASRGVDLRSTTDAEGNANLELVVAEDGSLIEPRSGRLGGLLAARGNTIDDALDALDGFANELIYQVNRIHSQAQPILWAGVYTSDYRVDDASAVLNSAAAGLAFDVSHGSFALSVTQRATGERQTTSIAVDLDGLDTDTSLNDLAAQLNAVENVNASVTPEGRLRVEAVTADFELSFSDDTSGVLAALGVNTFFTGTNALDVDVQADVLNNPDRVATAYGHAEGDNRAALAIAALRDTPASGSGGVSLGEMWRRHVEDLAVRVAQGRQEAEADAAVLQSLEAQRQAVSGVNVDEETINVLQLQRTFQASARFLSVVDEMMQTVLGLL